MADSATALPEESDTSRAAEWQRLEAEDGGGQPPAPEAGAAEQAATEQRDVGQASSPPAGPAADRPAGSDTAVDDLWKDAPPALRDAFKATEEARLKAENQVRTQTGRLQAEARRAAELSTEVVTLREKAKPAKEEAAAGPVLTEEQRATLREEYPDVAAPLLDAMGALEKTVNDLKAAGATAAEQKVATDTLEAQRFYAAEEQRLAETHGDWAEQVAKPEFEAWAKAQPRMIREAIVRNGNGIVDADEAIDIVNRWKAEVGAKAADPVATRREAQLNGGRVPQARTTVATPSTSSDKESEWKRLDAADRQREAARSRR